MRKIPLVVAGVLLGTGLVTGCGSTTSKYCDAVKADAATLTDFTSTQVQPDFSKVPAFLADAKDLQAKAPADVEKDWVVITSTLDSLADSLKDVGLTFAQFATFLDTGKLPADVTQAETAGLALKYQQLGTDTVTKATNDISDHAASACKVDLSKKG